MRTVPAKVTKGFARPLATLLAAPLLWPQAVRTEPALPGDVTAYVTRLRDCNQWGGEDATDAARGRAIAAAVKCLRCGDAEADERTLRRHHRGNPAVLKALDRARDADG
ncbi:hypothetical protein [Methylobacterium sp. J-090]|uniref:hypothetical protein n=1 Tax=Methylobacterium sp. J-090 TaxID=2836666 RepID=UPI001FBA6AC6|nr:hypothetical protein [Methylobacterium sp. J-090]MCJ2081813.1 hypothetical protein [Methylobacterium sp. J-090]